MTAMHSLRSMRRPRIAGLVGATALIISTSYAWSALMAPGRPVGTIDATLGAESRQASRSIGIPGQAPLPGAATGGLRTGPLAQIDHSIEAWTRNLAANPRDFISATNLATLFHGRGRLSFDLRDHERALAAARTAIAIEPGHAPARALEAAILYTLHDFEAALEAADALVREAPTQAGALATRFDAELELGRIDDARTDLAELGAIGGPGVTIRAARLASVTGDATAALAMARDARSAALANDTADAGFYAYAVGEYARLAGDASAARAAYRDALAVRADDLAALVGLARIDAFEGRLAAAIAGLRRATEIAPQPEALALLGDLLTDADDPGAADAYATVRFIEQLGDIRATTFDRQLLRFELDHGGATPALLEDARASLAARPDWTGHDTVAWALYRLGMFDEAAAEIEAARALGADNATLRFHEGAILLGQGAVAEGTRMLRVALDLGPALDPAERTEARRLLGD
jgi:tetratricopeptide (TPR) repeat protein